MLRSFAALVVALVLLAGCIEEAPTTADVPGLAKAEPKAPVLGDPAPAFEAESTSGPIKFPEAYAGKWVVLFSHPADFNPVSTTEFMRFAAALPEFRKIQCELVGLSADTVESHMQWLKEVSRIQLDELRDVTVEFPVIADPALEAAKLYGMVHAATDRRKTVRSVAVIDPAGIIRANLAYPPTVGRSVPEILRLVKALMVSDHFDVATPANWMPGDDVALKPLPTEEENRARARRATMDFHALAWFLLMKRLPDPERTLKNVKWPTGKDK
jgi:peroxiredoxin (alkyl hydroperoxide reductase subunit C)